MDIWADLPAMADMAPTHTTEDIRVMAAIMATVAMATHGTVLDMVTTDSMDMEESGTAMGEILTMEATWMRAIISRWTLIGPPLRWEADRADSLEEDLMIERDLDRVVEVEVDLEVDLVADLVTGQEIDLETDLEIDQERAIRKLRRREARVTRISSSIVNGVMSGQDHTMVRVRERMSEKSAGRMVRAKGKLIDRQIERLRRSLILNTITHLMTMDITKMVSQLTVPLISQGITLPMIHTCMTIITTWIIIQLSITITMEITPCMELGISPITM